MSLNEKAALDTVEHCIAMAYTLTKALQLEADHGDGSPDYRNYQLIAENISALLETVRDPIVEATAFNRVTKAG